MATIDLFLKSMFFTSLITTTNSQVSYPGGYSYNYGPWYSLYSRQQQQADPNYFRYNQPYGPQPQSPQPQNPATYWSNYDFRQNYDPKEYKMVNLPPSLTYATQPLDSFPKDVSVPTGLGSVLGKYVYMFDSPTIHFMNRPGTTGQPVANVMHNVSAFYGIPYARPPIGDLRFKPPERFGRLNTYSAYEYRSPCPQPIIIEDPMMQRYHNFNEDCLYLNIYTPDTRSGFYPVMIYIHGGEFETGSGNWFPGHMLSASQQVVVVTFNYRLGALGFLSTADEYSPGNYGMLDQAMAIQWVSEQIQYFRGDPQRITLFGPGSGAASSGLHMISPLTKDLIRRVIGQSGSPVADWAAVSNLERARNTSRIFGRKLGCTHSSSRKLIDCLRHRSAKELCGFDFKAELGFFPWAPIVDRDILNIHQDRFLPDSPRTLFLSRHFNPHTEYLCGVTEGEAAYLLLKDSSMIIHNYVVTQEYVNRKIREYILQYNYTLNPDGIYQAMTFMYTYWADPFNPVRIRDEYINMMSDALFKAPNDEMVKMMLVRDVRVYMYVLNTTVEAFNWDRWRATPHDIEYYLVSGAPFIDPSFYPPDKMMDLNRFGYSEGDREMSSFLMQAYANFAKHGQPTSTQIYGVNWKAMEQRPERILYYLNLNTIRNMTIQQDYRQRESAFWTNYLPTLIGPPPSTTPLPLDEQIEFQVGFYSAIAAALLFFVLFVIGCCLYCSSSPRRKDYYDDDEFSTNASNLNIDNEKREQHTTV